MSHSTEESTPLIFTHRHGAALVWGALTASTLDAAGCSGRSPGAFAQSLQDGGEESGDDTGGTGDKAGFSSGSSSGFNLGDTGTSSGGMGTGMCKNGAYAGTFQCTFVFDADAGDASASTVSADAGGLMVTGNISFQLTQMVGNGESFIDTASGSFSGTALTFFAIMADVGGTLNCNTGVFTGNLSNGTYSGFLFLNGTFSGPLDSQYNGTTFSFVDGSWVLTVPGEGSCPGTWTANYAGDQ
jgi:hypothetical protein